jgi:hypothetical protein
MQAANTIAVAGSIDRTSRATIQKAHGDDTKAYDASHRVPGIVGNDSLVWNLSRPRLKVRPQESVDLT